MKLTIEITGNNPSDLEAAVDVVQQKIREGYLSGFDSNDTGAYSFTIEGEAVAKE
mgnify:CR=1 FL=1